MPIGTYHRLQGEFRQTEQGYWLLLPGGGYWSLDLAVRATALLGRTVIVEGYRSGFNHLDVRSIAPLGGDWDDIIFDLPWWERVLMRWGWVKER